MMKNIKNSITVLTLFFSLFAPAAVSQAAEESPLTGTWGGVRTKLEDKGALLKGTYTGDYIADRSGGLRRKRAFVGAVDLSLTLDAEKMLGWKGTTLYLYGFGNNGGAPSRDNVGDAQGVSFYETGRYMWTINDASIEKKLFNDRVSVLGGLYDLSNDFDLVDCARLFLNSSYFVNPTISSSGVNGASIYPATSYGGRIRVQPIDGFTIQTAVLDGIPGKPVFGKSDGLLLATELSLLAGSEENSTTLYGKYAVGYWQYTAWFDDIADVDDDGNAVRRSGSSGFYGLIEKALYHEKENPDAGLAFFLRLGSCDPNTNQYDPYMSGGLVYTGLVKGRPGDKLGLAFASVSNSAKYRQSMSAAGTPVDTTEKNLELTYLARITPWLAIQPDFQFVINPGMDIAVKNAVVVGSRFAVSF